MSISTKATTVAALFAAVVCLPAGLASAAPVEVTYEVLGSGKAGSISYWDGNGQQQSESDVVLPWSKTLTVTRPMHSSIMVMWTDTAATCKITLNGTKAAEVKNQPAVFCEADVQAG